MARSSVFLKGWRPASCCCCCYYPCMVGLLLLVLVLQTGSGAVARPVTLDSVKFGVQNQALETAGGKRFEREVGTDFTVMVMRNATEYAWKVFGQGPDERKDDVDEINLVVSPNPNILDYADGNNIIIGDVYLEKLPNAQETIIKTCFRLVAYVWHPPGMGQPEGLVGGIAMYVAHKSGVQRYVLDPGVGYRWDQGFVVTGMFLEYCDSLHNNFVADLIRLITKDGYSDNHFQTLLGKTVDQVWADYKAKYGG